MATTAIYAARDGERGTEEGGGAREQGSRVGREIARRSFTPWVSLSVFSSIIGAPLIRMCRAVLLSSKKRGRNQAQPARGTGNEDSTRPLSFLSSPLPLPTDRPTDLSLFRLAFPFSQIIKFLLDSSRGDSSSAST